VVSASSPSAAPPLLYASVRSDRWLPDFRIEKQPSPTSGRRVQIVAQMSAGNISDSDLRSVSVDGAECLHLPSDDGADLSAFDWCRAHSNAQTGQLWVSYHTRNPHFSGGRALAVNATSTSGIVLVAGTVTAQSPPLVLSYVTTAKQGKQAIIHVHSAAKTSVGVARLLFDGVDVQVKNKQGVSVKIPSNGHAVFVADLQMAKAHGDVWTAVLLWSGANGSDSAGTAAWGGRVGPERFPIETWPKSSDCVLPRAPNETSVNSTEVRALGIDSVFEGFGRFKDNCAPNKDTADDDYAQALSHAAEDGWWHVFLDGENSKQWTKNAKLPLETRAKVVDAILIGDEVDGGVDAKHLRGKLNASLENIRSTPDLLTYQGAATNALIGAFAGIADIQGCDAYVAACAPTQASVIQKLPLSYPYQYLRNARDNHAPNIFWGYSQLWGGWSYEPMPNEIVSQVRPRWLRNCTSSPSLPIFTAP
jgi:hypothetical protein